MVKLPHNTPVDFETSYVSSARPLFFKKIFTNLSLYFVTDQNKSDIAQELINESNFGMLYWLQLFLSVIIATLGLLINSVPVIIGAMLIAPILLPIKTLAFSISTGNRHLYRLGLRYIVLSIVFGIGISYLVSRMIPLNKLTSEILSRTSPTIIDLGIAFAGGLIAFLSLGFKKLSESLAGVAMATSLIPPLCVVGIGIEMFNLSIAKGSFLLFVTNLFAILLIGVIVFFIFGFFPRDNQSKKRSLSNFIVAILSIIFLSIPLSNSMGQMINDISLNKTIQTTSTQYIQNIDPLITIDDISYQTIDHILRVNISINVPDKVLITQNMKEELSQILATKVNQSIELVINIISFSSVYIEENTTLPKEELVKNTITVYLNTYSGVVLIDTKLANTNNTKLVYLNLFSKSTQNQFKMESDIRSLIKEILGSDTVVIIRWYQDVQDPFTTITNDLMQKQQYLDAIKNFLLANTTNTYLEDLSFSKTTLTGQDLLYLGIKLSSSEDKIILHDKILTLKNILEERFGENVIITVKIFSLSEIFTE